VNCLATGDVTNRHIRQLSCFVSNDRQQSNAGQASDISRCSTGSDSSCIETFSVTGSDFPGRNRANFILREDKQLLSCIETVRVIVRKRRGIW